MVKRPGDEPTTFCDIKPIRVREIVKEAPLTGNPALDKAVEQMVEALEHYSRIDTRIWCAETDSEISVNDWAEEALTAYRKAKGEGESK